MKKNGIFDVVASCSIFDKYIFSKNIAYCLVIKMSICAKLYDLFLRV